MGHLIVFSQTDLGQCSAARFTYKGNVDDLFAWALVFAPVRARVLPEHGKSEKEKRSSAPPCTKCGCESEFVARLSPWIDGPGYRIYRCNACGHVDWLELPIGKPRTSITAE